MVKAHAMELEANASLRATTTNQILSPYDLFAWAKVNITGVIMFYVTSDDITNHEKRFDLQKRYEGLRTIAGTRSYHSFIPDGANLLLKRISSDIVHDTHNSILQVYHQKMSRYSNPANTSLVIMMMIGM